METTFDFYKNFTQINTDCQEVKKIIVEKLQDCPDNLLNLTKGNHDNVYGLAYVGSDANLAECKLLALHLRWDKSLEKYQLETLFAHPDTDDDITVTDGDALNMFNKEESLVANSNEMFVDVVASTHSDLFTLIMLAYGLHNETFNQ